MGNYDSDKQRLRSMKRWGDPIARFWSRVDKSGEHWLWTGATASGYGVVRWDGKQDGAHRVSLMLTGVELPNGYSALHKCDIKKCVRPDHLFRGTQLDNMHDMVKKGRQAKDYNHPSQIGELNHAAKYNSEIVKLVKKMFSDGVSQREIARQTGVHYGAVWTIVHGVAWAHVS